MKRPICEICGMATNRPVKMCAQCGIAYDKEAHEDGSVMEAIVWAARRARWYERRAHRLRLVRAKFIKELQNCPGAGPRRKRKR